MRRSHANIPCSVRRQSPRNATAAHRSTNSRCTVITAAMRPLPSPAAPDRHQLRRLPAANRLRRLHVAARVAGGSDSTPTSSTNTIASHRLPRVIVTSGTPTKRSIPPGGSTTDNVKNRVLNAETLSVSRRLLASRSLSCGSGSVRDKNRHRVGFDPGHANNTSKKSVTVVLNRPEPYTRVDSGRRVKVPGSNPRSAVTLRSAIRKNHETPSSANTILGSHKGSGGRAGGGDVSNSTRRINSIPCENTPPKRSYYDTTSGRITIPSHTNMSAVSNQRHSQESANGCGVSGESATYSHLATRLTNVSGQDHASSSASIVMRAANNNNNSNNNIDGLSRNHIGAKKECSAVLDKENSLLNHCSRDGRSISVGARASSTGDLPRRAAEILRSIDYIPHSRYLCRLLERHGHLAPLVNVHQSCNRKVDTTAKENRPKEPCGVVGESGDGGASHCVDNVDYTAGVDALPSTRAAQRGRKVLETRRSTRLSPRVQLASDSRTTCKSTHSTNRCKSNTERLKELKTDRLLSQNIDMKQHSFPKSHVKRTTPSSGENCNHCVFRERSSPNRLPKRCHRGNSSVEGCQHVCYCCDKSSVANSAIFVETGTEATKDQMCQTSPKTDRACSTDFKRSCNHVSNGNRPENGRGDCVKQQDATKKKCIHRYLLDEKLFLRPCGHEEIDCPVCASVQSCHQSKNTSCGYQCPDTDLNIADRSFELTVPMALFDDNVKKFNPKANIEIKSRTKSYRGSSSGSQQMAFLRRGGRGLNPRFRRCRGSVASSPSYQRLTSTASQRRFRA